MANKPGPRIAKTKPLHLPVAAAPPRLRVLVISHGHPAFTRGGAEIAAYALYQGLRSQPDCEAWFLGCDLDPASPRVGVGITQPLDAHEYVYRPGPFDFFKFANRDAAFPAEFKELLLELRPDIIHFHHFAVLGIEAFELARQALPQVRIVLTVHEYLLMCHALGQMVTRSEQNLCYRATLQACHACFPEIPAADFFLRKTYIQRFIAHVDAFISPSQFLAGRLREWGVEASRLDVIENVVASPARTPPAPALLASQPLRVGFFGQISRLKGTTVLLEAAALLAADGVNIVFDIHGIYRGQLPEFQEEFLRLLSAAGQNVRYHGGYQPQDVDTLMRAVDIVLVPSIWWENSPVVIQEAFRNGCPVICSDIGGMAEKVRAGRNGWHFPVGSPLALVALLKHLEADRAQIAAIALMITPMESVSHVVQAHRVLYAKLRQASEEDERRFIPVR